MSVAIFGLGRSSTLGSPGNPTDPALSDSNKAFCVRLVRRTMRDQIVHQSHYTPDFVPKDLQGVETEVVVRLRQGGFLLAESSAGPGHLATVVRDAALSLCKVLQSTNTADADLLSRLLVEVEVIGGAEVIETDKDWTKPHALLSLVEPGVHGMVVIGNRKRHRFCPTELITSDIVLAEALQALAQDSLSDPSKIPQAKLMRFRTLHWYQAKRGAEVVSLHRGLTVVSPSAVSSRSLAQAIETLGAYMAYRQLPSGLFTYEYQPASDFYSKEDNIVRQLGAVLGLSHYARWSGGSSPRAASALGIRYHLQGLTEVAAVDNASYLATADKKNKLGVTALLALALARHPDARSYDETRERLVNGMLWLQRPSGMFITAFPPAEAINAQAYFPGEALLALAESYRIKPSGQIADAFDRAIEFYRSYFRDVPTPAFVPWQVQAFSVMAHHGKRRDYVDFVFELTDWLAARQLNQKNCDWPEMWGGIAAYGKGRAGVATASYLEGFADALALARSVGDKARAARYETLVRGAARFVLQLQVRPEEMYFTPSPQDAIGGIRTAPALNLLRIDHCQHALIGLIKARQVLFPESD